MMNNLQFAPFQTFVSPTFWHKLAEIKLDVGLADDPKQIFGFYTHQNANSCLMELDYTAFNSIFKAPKNCHITYGTNYNKNTIEEFKECDKRDLLRSEGLQMLDDFKSGRILANPNLLTRFLVVSFTDIKSFNYYYWFCYPCLMTPPIKCLNPSRKLGDIADLQPFMEIIKNIPTEESSFFVLKQDEVNKFYTLKEIFDREDYSDIYQNSSLYYFCFSDASAYEHPSWHMRIYIAFILFKCPALIGKVIQFIGIRVDNKLSPSGSCVWCVTLDESIEFKNEENIKFVGWELNDKNKPGPRLASMSDSMDSKKLAESSVNLNLKLMKWRLLPSLKLNILQTTKCLLFGSGTLGCAVARNLLGWGFKHISLLDNGKVGFSNPVRQSLFTHADAENGKAMKAEIASMRIKEINPNVTSNGYVLKIPMPGHSIDGNMISQTEEELNKIISLIEENDVIFLLTDSRESRWLPTLIGAVKQKIVINAALGFDSYLVMRHGIYSSTRNNEKHCELSGDTTDLKCIEGTNLGCYFCNDVTAPGNSMKDRTLDQQCTVTRPGVSNIAGSYAVELLVALLQHPQGIAAPAYYSTSNRNTDLKIPEGILGIIPHSIRGHLSNYENVLPATQKFKQCIACSEAVIKEYLAEGNACLLRAIESGKYLEDLTGISDYNKLDNEIINFDDSDLTEDDDYTME